MLPTQLTSIAAVDAWLDQVSHTEAGALSGSEQAALIQELQRIERRVVAARLHVLAAAEKSRTATCNGAASTAAWVATLTHADPQAAFREVRLANEVEDSPAVGTSLGRGDISPAHASVIVDASRKLPATITPAQREVVEQTGLFDADTFFMHCDDVDLSWRARLAGWEIAHQPDARVFHDKRIGLAGYVEPSASEALYGALGHLLLAYKYGRDDVVRDLSAQLRVGSPEQKEALARYEQRVSEGRLPHPRLDPEGHVSQFSGGTFAPHRF